MAPTSIDGNDITGATIDGQDVSEITVDGQTVFTAIPDSGLVHRYSAKSQSDATALLDQQGSTDMSAVGAPTYSNSLINGYPGFTTDGNDDAFSSGLWSIPNSGWTIAFVGRFATEQDFKYAWAQGDVSSRGIGLAKAADDQWIIVQDDTNHLGGTIDQNLHKYIATYDGSNVLLEVDGSVVINESATDPSPSGDASIGGDVNQGRYQNLEFGEFLLYNSDKNSIERSEINDYLNREWEV